MDFKIKMGRLGLDAFGSGYALNGGFLFTLSQTSWFHKMLESSCFRPYLFTKDSAAWI
jgi:hypothetical protein